MKKLNEFYQTPCMEVAEMQVEQCILSGSPYGEAGAAGQESVYLDFGDDL